MLGNEYGKTLPFLLYSGGHNKPSCSQRASQLASECECVDVRCSQLACDVTYWWSSMRSSAFCRRRESVSSMSLARDCSTQLTHAQHNTAASATVSYSQPSTTMVCANVQFSGRIYALDPAGGANSAPQTSWLDFGDRKEGGEGR